MAAEGLGLLIPPDEYVSAVVLSSRVSDFRRTMLYSRPLFFSRSMNCN